MSGITTHVLDTSRGRPAAGVAITLERMDEGRWQLLGRGHTDSDGRLRDLLKEPLTAATYRLTFGTGAYFKAGGGNCFFPEVTVTFDIQDTASHYHVPLLLSPYGYTTYRGS